MDYFKHFPQRTFTFDVNGHEKKVKMTDIMTSISMSETVVVNQDLRYLYQWQDTDVIDKISTEYYQSIGLWWLVLMSNEVIDPFFEMPVPGWQIVQRAISKWRQTAILNGYGNNDQSITEFMQTIIYEYRDGDGDVIDETTYNNTSLVERRAVTILDYEIELNDFASQVQLVDNNRVGEVISRFEKLMEDAQ